MQYAFFSIPALAPITAQQELNQFLSSHRIVAVDWQRVDAGDEANA